MFRDAATTCATRSYVASIIDAFRQSV